MRKLVAWAVLWASATAWAQQPAPGCTVLGTLFEVLSGTPCKSADQTAPQTAPQPPASQRTWQTPPNLDTPENLAALVGDIRDRYSKLDLSRATFDDFPACYKELQPYERYRHYINSGFDELQRKCEQQTQPLADDFQQQLAAAAKERREAAERERAAAAAAEKQKDAAQRANAIAQLRSGQRAPINCAQYMVTKGQDHPEALNAPVMAAAYQAPVGLGQFLGVVDQINGDTFVISGKIPDLMRLAVNPPDNTILVVGKDARVFNGQAIQVGAMVQGFATQSATRTVQLQNGRSSTVAVMRAVCLMPWGK